MIRVSAQLIDGDNGLERWSENYDRTPGDAIKIQIDIATKVARALSVALGQAGKAALTAGGTNNAKAQDLLFRARELYNQADSKVDVESAMQLADRAIVLDPNYAEAYAWKVLFLDYARSRYSTSAADLSATQREMLRFASRAVELAPNSATAHLAHARYFESILDMGRAGHEYRRALQLAQGDAAVLPSYSVYATIAVSPAEGTAMADKAVALDPLNPDAHRARINALLDARRFAEAVRVGMELERNSPELFNAPIFVGDSLFWLGRFDEAANYYRRRPPDHFARITGEAMIQIRRGDREGAQRNLARLQQILGEAASYQYGQIYAQLGDKDRAFAALERAWTVKDPGLIRLRVDPALDPLRSDSRYKIIEEKLNFP
jgi:serine/threonine-protein kinase